MTGVLLYFFTAIVFFAVDMVGINLLVQPVALDAAGAIFLDGFRALPAILFYIGYAGGIFWFVTAPAMRSGAGLGSAFLSGAGLGAVAYGTYELTNLATLAAWTWRLTLVDLAWGTVLTGFSAAAGLWLTRLTRI
ncbi:DUF2177 family protein [Pikeienuella sp. HZG-20]|uniref:DUF2177 family protein n=1 Tax=Paludibacillus litoralis TaxID=3133267 RepID=UPI0030EDFB13